MKEQQIDDINSLQYYYPKFQDLIKNSKPQISKNLKIYISQEKFIADLDFDIEIESVCGNSTIWVASSINITPYYNVYAIIKENGVCHAESENRRKC